MLDDITEGIFYIITALGITISPDVYLQGIFFALGAAMLINTYVKNPIKKDKLIFSAVFIATVVSWGWGYMEFTLPVQLGMAVSGLVSNMVLSFIANKFPNYIDSYVKSKIDVKDDEGEY